MYKYEVLFVCSANVGRSQMAEGFYNYYRPGKAISAAGIHDLSKKYKFPHPDIIEVMQEKGVNISQQQVRFVTDSLVRDSERIIAFCDLSRCPAYMQNNQKVKDYPVEDPCPGNPDDMSHEERLKVFRITRDDIERIILELLHA